ncbi:MAG TPA: HAMP domain-containing sensor histidine kinase [Acidimicrobiia bacterium]|nr:HAMP domain-containing sensor histidine kinase [Acidimicrobiia bacterium]
MTGDPRNVAVSRYWLAGILLAASAALVALFAAVVNQIDATRPVGEGELFAADAALVAEVIQQENGLDTAVRTARNRLGILAVSVIDADFTYVASSSPNLVGASVDIPFFRRDPMPMRALTAPAGHPIHIDGIEEAPSDLAMYQVLIPVDDGTMALMFYDLRNLTLRRAGGDGITPLTLLLGSLGLLFVAATAALSAGRAGARRRIIAGFERAEELETRARELAQHNRSLSEARSAAEQALALAEEKNRIRSEFVLMINHELNTPLTGVVTSAELLAAHPDMSLEERQHLVDAMIQQGDLLKRLVSRMLTLARLENRRLGYSLRPVTGDALVADLPPGTGTDIVEPPASWAVMTDPEGMASVLSTIVENAMTHGGDTVRIAFTEGLPFEPELTIGEPPHDGRYVVVSDDGPGIDPDFLPRIFEKFEKRSDSPGTGLGLYLARLMVEAMGGSIAVTTGPTGSSIAVGGPVPVEAIL